MPRPTTGTRSRPAAAASSARSIFASGRWSEARDSASAAATAFRKAFEKARPVLLEPIVSVEVTVPAANFGDISADMSTRRGHITGMDTLAGGLQVIQAIVPLAEMLSYATNLKSMTSGQGSFTMELRGYEPVPPNVQQQIVERYQKSRAGIEEE